MPESGSTPSGVIAISPASATPAPPSISRRPTTSVTVWYVSS